MLNQGGSVGAVEILAIVLGNVATIIVFWKRRFHFKRTYYLLINLTVADLMVGVSNIESVVGEIIKARSSICKVSWRDYVVLDIVFECSSINFLVLISAVWPFRLRTTSTRKYIYSIRVVGFLSGLLPVVKLLSVFRLITEGMLKKLSSVHSCACLLLLLCAYTLIWFFSKKPDLRDYQ